MRYGIYHKWEHSKKLEDQWMNDLTYKEIVDRKHPDDAIRLFGKSVSGDLGGEFLDQDKKADMLEALAYAHQRKSMMSEAAILSSDDPDVADLKEALLQQKGAQ